MTRLAYRLAASLVIALAVVACGSSAPSASPAASVERLDQSGAIVVDPSERAGRGARRRGDPGRERRRRGRPDRDRVGPDLGHAAGRAPGLPRSDPVRGGGDRSGDRGLRRRRREAGSDRDVVPGCLLGGWLLHRFAVGAVRGRRLHPRGVRRRSGLPALADDRAARRDGGTHPPLRGRLPPLIVARPGRAAGARRQRPSKRRMLAADRRGVGPGAWGRRHADSSTARHRGPHPGRGPVPDPLRRDLDARVAPALTPARIVSIPAS